ncbi:MAG: class I tRNA ligase family protein, partial [Planctomycetaceae bacterium]|nr:class I tRNA ligase family protein [Planctomycetaceae bacterium]
RKAVNYKLRDWLFSRQHFWGEPFPILHELDSAGKMTGRTVALDASELPLDMPKGLQFDAAHNSPEPPLEHAPQDWLFVTKSGKQYKRETNTMPQWAGSCWYYLRFIDPKNGKQPVAPELEKRWMPVDLYVGGAEHAVLHLLYARFWHKVLYDYGIVSQPEPFQKLVNQGMILGEDGQKMSKSRGNVINPDDVVAKHGADSLRLYEMFMGPLESVKPWSMDSVSGVRGFLDRVWKMLVDAGDRETEADSPAKLNTAVQDIAPAAEQNRVLHKTIKAVTEDIRNMSFNTAIARMMEFTNFFLKESVRPKSAMESFVLILSPFAPHICEELWSILGHTGTLAYESFPSFDEAALIETALEIPVSINGKLRSKIVITPDANEDVMEQSALSEPKIAELLQGKTIIKKIIVKGKMVNFVVK